MNESLIVGIVFSKVGKVYHFDARQIDDIKVSDHVVVVTSKGRQLGQVAQIVQDGENIPKGRLKAVERRATPVDLLSRQVWRKKEPAAVELCRDKLSKLDLPGVKIVDAEYSFDGHRLRILVSSSSEDKIDVRALRKSFQGLFDVKQFEIFQIGPRDVAKLLGGMGACGMEKRCCSQFLHEFCSIGIRMAKDQGISLTPTEITGMCGRLRCCLRYEHSHYAENLKQLPKRNKRVITPEGEGRVVDVMPLKASVNVDLGEAGRKEFTKEEIQLVITEPQGSATDSQKPSRKSRGPRGTRRKPRKKSS
jgi:cell fate regulator YaaT (PSP1 superfamily)